MGGEIVNVKRVKVKPKPISRFDHLDIMFKSVIAIPFVRSYYKFNARH